MKYSDISNIPLDQFRLENSLCLYANPDPANPIICLQLYIKTGSVRESAKMAGYAHFLEHLVFKSTAKYPANSISAVASSMGMMLNAYTDFDATCFYVMLPRERLSEGMDILAQMALYADFSEDDVQSEKDIIIEEIYQYESDPEMSFIEHIQANYFKKSPLSHPVLGTLETVGNATRSSLRAFYRKHYRPNNAFLVASGDFECQKMQDIFTSAFSVWKQSALISAIKPSLYRERFALESRKRKGPELLALVLPELNERHQDSEALHIAIRYLAIGKSSLLHKELVEERKLCSFVKVSSLSGLLSGVSVVLIAPIQPRFKAVIIDTVFRHWAQILRSGVPAEAIDLIKKDIIHSWLYSFDGVEHKANLIAAEVFNEDLARIQNYADFVQGIDNAWIIKAVNEFWPLSRLAIFYQGQSVLKYESLHLNKYELSARLPASVQNASQPNYPDDEARVARLSTAPETEYYEFVLPGGMKVVYNYVPQRPVCGFTLSTPLCQLSESKPGVNYFTSALMLYGTRKYDHNALMRVSRKKGFNIRVQHHLDSTLFRGKCHYQHLPFVMSLLQEILLMPVFSKSHLHMLQTAAMDNLRREQNYPASYAYSKWFTQLFGKKNNLLRATGESKDIRAISVEDCQKWHQNWHIGRDFSLCIVGSLELKQIRDLCEEYFSSRPTPISAFPQVLSYRKDAAKQIKQYKHKEQSIIHLGGFACPASRRLDNSAFHVLAQALGGDLSSRLYAILREKYGYAYQIGFDFSSIKDLGFWYAYAFCDPQDQRDCLKVMKQIINDVSHNGITEEELSSAKNYLISVNRFDSESLAFRAAHIANLLSLDYDLDFYLDRESRIAATTIEQINALAGEWLSADNQYTHVLV
jgi:zinc protease